MNILVKLMSMVSVVCAGLRCWSRGFILSVALICFASSFGGLDKWARWTKNDHWLVGRKNVRGRYLTERNLQGREKKEESGLVDLTGTRVSKSGGEVTGIRSEASLQKALDNACQIAQICDQYRGQDTVILDVTHITPLFDYFVITTGRSRRQLHAIADHSDDVMDQTGSKRLSTSGYETEWICQDYGDVVLHVFSPSARELYSIEKLWADAQRVEFAPATAPAEATVTEDQDVAMRD